MTHGIEIILPYPSPVLNPNNKSHWRKKWRAQQEQKKIAGWMTMAANKPPEKDIYLLEVCFFPPDNRRRDEDNALASMKHAFDGIAEVWGVDDCRFRYLPKWYSKVKDGKVIIKLGVLNEE